MNRSDEAAESCKENEVLSTRNEEEIRLPAPEKSNGLSSVSFESMSTSCAPPAVEFPNSMRDFVMAGRIMECDAKQKLFMTHEQRMAYNRLQKYVPILPRCKAFRPGFDKLATLERRCLMSVERYSPHLSRSKPYTFAELHLNPSYHCIYGDCSHSDNSMEHLRDKSRQASNANSLTVSLKSLDISKK